MALDGNKTGSAVYNLIKSTKVSDEASCEILWQKIVSKIFEDIKSDAQVLAGIPVSTIGSATAQTGATTGPGSIQ